MFAFKNFKNAIFWDVTPMFRRNVSPQLRLLRNGRPYIPQDHTFHRHRLEKLKSPTFKELFVVHTIIRS
jgi:hypothetical protein